MHPTSPVCVIVVGFFAPRLLGVQRKVSKTQRLLALKGQAVCPPMPLSLHDALPISSSLRPESLRGLFFRTAPTSGLFPRGFGAERRGRYSSLIDRRNKGLAAYAPQR